MNREEFMRRLTELLGDVPPMEREEAIQYYNDYFDDAGTENESGVIASLGTPEELARTIKAGLSDGGNGGEFTESGFSGYSQVHKDEVMRTEETSRQGSAQRQNNPYEQQGQNAGYTSGGQQPQQPKQGMSGGMIALIVILAVLTFPIWIGLVAGLFGIVVGIFAALFGIFAAFLSVGVVLVVVSIALLIAGIALLFSMPLGGLCVIGTSLILFALGLVFIWLMVLIVATVIPALVKGIAALGRRLFRRGGAQA